MQHGRFPELLECLNLGELSRILGEEILTGLSDVGLPITKGRLIEMLLTSRGVGILSEKTCREIVFSKSSALSLLNLSNQSAQQIINFSWARNFELVADLIKIDAVFLAPHQPRSSFAETPRADSTPSDHDSPNAPAAARSVYVIAHPAARPTHYAPR